MRVKVPDQCHSLTHSLRAASGTERQPGRVRPTRGGRPAVDARATGSRWPHGLYQASLPPLVPASSHRDYSGLSLLAHVSVCSV